jgi:tocopherol cyclase
MLKLWQPAVFQGNLKKTGYFEGWYYKNVSPDEKVAYEVIPGVSLPKDREKAHAFVQVFDAREGRSYYFRYPIDEFRADEKTFDIDIGGNHFSLDRVRLDIDRDGAAIKADLKYGNIRSWPVSLLCPGAMGWYGLLPMMECYHDVLSFNNSIEGFFELNGRKYDFTGGKGYMEKDWGTSMPSSWIWMQTNHFGDTDTSLFGSIANIPWLGHHFIGYLFGFLLDGRIYRFTTYTGAKLKGLKLDGNRITFSIEDSQYRLEIKGERAGGGAPLIAPMMGEMSVKIHENLKSEIHLALHEKKGRGLLFTGAGKNAGLEYVGDMSELINGLASH